MNYNKYQSDDSESTLLNESYFEEIHFSGHSQSYCVLFVDMVDSTKTTAEISDAEKVRKYFSMYLNTMASILRRNNARIIKNVGDSLISYFPNTSNSNNESAFEDVLECGIDMIVASPVINDKLYNDEGLPSLNYRISADYGQVEMAKSGTSQSFDLLGSTVNLCSKINSHAQPGGMVIGGDLYRIIKSFNKLHTKYHFKQAGEYTIGFAGKINKGNFGGKYPIYTVNFLDTRNSNHDSSSNISSTNKQRPNKFESRLEAMKRIVVPSSYFKEEKPGWPQQKYPHNLMLIDDEPDIPLTYKSFLDSERYRVDAFTDAHEALKHFALNSSHYDLIIMDIRMPGLNGLQLYHRIKAINKDIKVIFATALDAADELVSILPDIKSNYVIRKPVGREDFVKTIRTVLA